MILTKTEPLFKIRIETSKDKFDVNVVNFNNLPNIQKIINWSSNIRYFSMFTSSLKVTLEANNYIDKYKLMSHVDDAYILIKDIINKELFTNYYTYVDVANDIENPEWEAIKIVVSVNHTNYKDILKTWRIISTSFHSKIPMEISKKIYIVLKKTETKRYIV